MPSRSEMVVMGFEFGAVPIAGVRPLLTASLSQM